MGWDAELEDFKSLIDLRAYASEVGYTLSRHESWRGSAVMRNQSGDKIVIKREPDGHYVYFSVRDERDNGTIIDFVQRRKRLSFGDIRKHLRPWLGRPATSLPSFTKLEPTPKDRHGVERAFAGMKDAPRHPYLERERHIPAALVSSPRFAGRIRIDARSNAVFPHFDELGICGFELKNHGFTGFARGGQKGLWRSCEFEGDNRLVFAEGAIDALSHAALFPDERTRYASVGGAVNPEQPGLVRAAVVGMPDSCEIVAAMDADADGRKLAEIIRDAVAASGRADLVFKSHFPALNGQDWNDVLRDRACSFPAVRVSGP